MPLLLTAPGQVGADTKSYLYLDPSRLLERAPSMWDPNIGMGTVTHQNIGYLFPMGPFFWLTEAAGLPMWVGQRLWLGSILFLAGAGVWFLLRTLRWTTLPATVAAFAYALTPYTLSLAARISVILLPFAGLPWLIAFTMRAIRRGGWRDPALFALTVLVIGGVNATALVFAGFGALLWFPFAVWGTREATLREATAAFARIGVLTVLTSLWWIAGLVMQGSYGIEILRYTETAKVVAAASVAPEVLRGLGYWFFYGGDRLGPWIEPSVEYTQRLWLIGVTYLSPVLALLGAAMSRWRHRAYFVALTFSGVFIAVGAHPWDDPPLTGQAWKSLLLSDRGLALRSTPRAVPLVALGLAVLLAAGFTALARAAPRAARPVGLSLVALAVLGLPPLYTGGMVAANLQRPEDLPQYWVDAAAALDARPHDTRVLELPGSDFASYRWGNTVDPITPGIMDRPYVARELIPYGSPASADLLNALDRRLQENTLEAAAIAPLARLMGVGDVVARNDLQYERFRVARPYEVLRLLDAAGELGAPQAFGPGGINQTSPIAPLVDEAALRDDDGRTYAPVLAFPVEDAVPIVRAASADRPVLVAGDGEGLVTLASAGLLDGDELVQYAGSFAGEPDALRQALDRGAVLVVTDSNRRRARRWSTLRDNVGYTETAGERPMREDLTDNRLAVFPDASDDSYTVAVFNGGVTAQATSYGNPITYTPEFRAANAVDGDTRTSWRTASASDARGESLVLRFATPVDTDHITVTQLLSGFRNRTITDVDLRFDGSEPVRVQLDETSSTVAGQEISFDRRTFGTLELTIRGDDSGRVPQPGRPVRFNGLSQVGFSEVDVEGRRGDEIVRLPVDLLAGAGDASSTHPLTLVLERLRVDAAESVREDEETSIVRTWTQPTARTFTLEGEARLSPRVGDDLLDLLLGVIGPTATSSRRLPGDLTVRASSAIDGDPATAWSPAFDVAGDDALTFQVGRPVTFSRLDLMVVADGRHSVPTHVRIEADGRAAASFTVPAVPDTAGARGANAAVRVPIELSEPVTGSTITLVFDDVRETVTTDWFSNASIRMPVAIAELGIEGIASVPSGDSLDTGCRTDLLSIDGDAVGVEITGSTTDASEGGPLRIALCGFDADGVPLAAGDHVLRAAKGLDTGIDIDRLVLQSGADGQVPAAVQPLRPGPAGAPTVQLTRDGRTDVELTITNPSPGTPFWVVLGQSHNAGWAATADGRDLGAPVLVDGHANGWLVSTPAETIRVHLKWEPQRIVWIALALSALGVALCLVLAIRRPRTDPPDVMLQADEPELFQWNSFVRSRGAPPSRRDAAMVAAGAGVATAAIVGPLAGLVVALVAYVAAGRARARWWLALGGPGLLAVSGLYVLARQARSRPTAAFEWPGEQAAVHQVAWLAVALVVTLVVVDALWASVTRRRDEATDAAVSAPLAGASPADDAPDFPPLDWSDDEEW